MGKFKQFWANLFTSSFLLLAVVGLAATHPITNGILGGSPEMTIADTPTRAMAHMAMDSCRGYWWERKSDTCLDYIFGATSHAVHENVRRNLQASQHQRGVAGPYGH